jgi:hypothetical protein
VTHFRTSDVRRNHPNHKKAYKKTYKKKHLEALPVFLYLISHKTGAKMFIFVFFIGMIQLIQAYKSMLLETKVKLNI